MSQLKKRNIDDSLAVLKNFFDTTLAEIHQPGLQDEIRKAGKALDHLVKILQRKMEEDKICPIGQSTHHSAVICFGDE